VKQPLKLWFIAPVAAMALVVAGCSSSGAPQPGPTTDPAVGDQGDITELVEAAQAEGTLTWYTGQTESIAQETSAAFKAEYGIDVQYISLNAGTLSQRYQTEAESGAVAADVISQSSNPTFVDMAIDEGWGMTLTDAELPVLELGEFPEEYFQGDNTATIGFLPYLMFFNKDLISGNDVPETLEDLTDAKYEDKLILADPTTADNLVQFYDVIFQEYGDEWFEDVLKNNPKFYPTISNGVQAMTAGEGAIATPAAMAVAIPLIEAGAPLGTVTPPVTTGPEVQVMLTASDKAPHPNAGKLFVNWLLSKSGNLAAWGDLAISVYDTEAMPSGYTTARPVTPEIKNNILELLGLPTV
jgi:iron(III) transport system substrate-binding protein